jgi:outer membrane receptor protein involved in Fe transport
MIMCRHQRPAACFMLLALSLVIASPAAAQRPDGTISGVVKDPSGAVVPGATVTITSIQTGAVRNTLTSAVGNYTVPNLPVGTYNVKVEAAGFAPYSRTNVLVQAAQVVEVSGELTIQATAQTIQVQAGADLVQVQSSQLSKSFDNKMVAELPTVGGQNTSVLNLAVYLPNTTTALGGTSGSGGSIGGLRGRQNSFSIDGVNNNDPSVTIVSQQVIPDAVQEFSLSTNQFSAEFGTAAGGQFNVVTKRGTNELHGGAWLYNSNRNYRAKSNLADPAHPNPRFDYNRTGGSLGGPIFRNRWFAFGAFEYQTQGREALGSIATLPTASGLQTMKTLAVNDAVRGILAEFPTAATQSGTIPVTVGNATTLIPIGQASLSAPDYVTQYDYLINSDLNLAKHSVRGGYIYTRRRLPQAPTVPQPQFFGSSANDNTKVSLGDIWVLNNTSVNELRASYSRFINGSVLEGIASTFPNVEITGGLGVQIGPPSNYPQGRTMNQYQIMEQFNKLHGAHSFKAGAEVRWYTGVSDFLQNSRGIYYYSNIGNLLMDQVPANDQLQGIGSGVVSLNARNMAVFFQDDFKLSPRLTVNAGVRYEYYGNPAGAANQQNNSVSDLPGTPLVFHTPATDKNNIAPGLVSPGISWGTGNGLCAAASALLTMSRHSTST